MNKLLKIIQKNYVILLGLIPTILIIVDYFLKWQIFIAVGNFFLRLIYPFIIKPIGQDFLLRPYSLIFILFLFIMLYLISRRLKIVAGQFKEDFKEGLSNWEFGSEGWRIERGQDGLELSVTNSGDGGITNFGIWDNFRFSFECKVISKCAGWIIKAKDRVNYFMIQCSLSDPQELTINPHFRVGQDIWLRDPRPLNLKNPIKPYEWFKVDIGVLGNTIDVFINKEHVLHYIIPDPGLAITALPLNLEEKKEKGQKAETEEQKKERLKKYILNHNIAFSFPNGKVGFRCHGDEHAHFRKIKVVPLAR